MFPNEIHHFSPIKPACITIFHITSPWFPIKTAFFQVFPHKNSIFQGNLGPRCLFGDDAQGAEHLQGLAPARARRAAAIGFRPGATAQGKAVAFQGALQGIEDLGGK